METHTAQKALTVWCIAKADWSTLQSCSRSAAAFSEAISWP